MSPIQLYEDLAPSRSSKQIRVLDVVADQHLAFGEAHIEGVLRLLDLDHNPSFAALSYVWGDDLGSRYVSCSGTHIPITSSCYEALWHLRQKLGDFTIWIDAICINQQDKHEKEHQIPLMEDIYTKAAAVYVWLGRSFAGSNQAMNWLAMGGLRNFKKDNASRERYSHARAACSFMLSPWNPYYHPLPLRHTPRLQHTRFTQMEPLLQLLDHRWLDRVWTYQEILLASNPILVCGAAHVAWSDLITSLCLLSQLQIVDSEWLAIASDREKLGAPLELEEHQAFVDQVIQLREIMEVGALITAAALGIVMLATGIVCVALRKLDARSSTAVLLVGTLLFISAWSRFFYRKRAIGRDNRKGRATDDIVEGLFHRKATQPEDMAYGVWAILRRRGATLPEPNLSDGLDTVYHTLTKNLISVTRSLKMLPSAASQERPLSWVPDWSALDSVPYTEGVGWNGRSLILGNELSQCQRLERETFTFAFDGDILILRGQELGFIDACIELSMTSESYVPTEVALMLANRQALLNFNALISKRSEFCIHDYDSETEMHYVYRLAGLSFLRTEQSFTEFLKGAFACEEISVTDFLAACNSLAASDRKICWAKMAAQPKTCYLTTCLTRTRIGDKIVRLHGLPQPLVTRTS